MGLLVAPRAATFSETEGWLADWVRGGSGETDSGIYVNPRNGLSKSSTVWKCVQWRANQFGMLPKKVNERTQILGRDAQRPAPLHPLHRIVHTNPNPMLSAKAYWGLVSADLHLWGNSYAYIERGPSTGRPRNLWRFTPGSVALDTEKSQLRYRVTDETRGIQEFFLPEEILHIRGLGYDGLQGYSPITLMRQQLGWNAAAMRYGAQFFKNAGRISALISITNPIKPEAKTALIESLSKSGREAGKVALIEGDAKYSQMSMPQDDAQFIETMQFQEEDICGIMGVPQHKVGILRRSTNNNIEHQGIESVTDCIQPLAVEVEQWVNLQLLSHAPSSGRGGGTERERYFMECELKGLMRGDTAAQTAHIMTMIDKGVYSQNDARDYLGLPPVEGGDTYWMNMAYGPLDTIKELMTKELEAPEPEPEGDPPTENAAEKEMQARFARVYSRTFTDAFRRTVNKDKVQERKRVASTAFGAALGIIADGQGIELDEGFTQRYLGGIALRSLDWTKEQEAETVAAELERAVTAILERKTA
jgi:HK97 family phage portal protein